MNKLVFQLRRNPLQFSSSLPSSTLAAIRGPKKKKGAVSAEKAESSDIVNIFKDREDAKIYPSERYPPWLLAMLDETYGPDDVLMQIYRGERIPDAKEQWTLANSFRRQLMKAQNKMWRDSEPYESEDDDGEDVG